MIDKTKKILIVGLGLIGGSYAQGLSDEGYEVGAIDINQDSINYGIENKLIKHGHVVPTKDYVEQFDIVVFALYPHLFVEWIKQYQDYFKPGIIITDVTGIKGWLIKEMSTILRNDVEFVGAHPMAGREVYGVKNSKKEIFYGANYIVTPTSESSEYAISVVEELGRILKFKNIVHLSIDEHDEMIGFLSQLTHCIAVSLMTCNNSHELVQFTGDSFRDLTRIAKINENMWSELFLLNKDQLLKQMDLFINQFKQLRDTIEHNDPETMKDIMRLSTERRSYFDK